MRIPVTAAFLSRAVLIPKILQAEKTLTQTKLPGIKMYYEDNTLFVERNGYKGGIPGSLVDGFLIGEVKEDADYIPTTRGKKASA